jgi:hypothetical protein
LAGLRRFGIGIQVGQQSIEIGGSSLSEVVDESFYRFPAGLTKNRRAAIIGGKGLHEGGVKVVLTDQQSETITKARLTVVMAVGSICLLCAR